MRVIFACAGTGGHVNPAIAIANNIIKNEQSSKVLFIGSKTGIENELTKKAGFEIQHIRTGKILRTLTLKNIKAIYNTYMGISDSKKIIKEFKPDIIIGTGGYICGPVMLAAKKCGIPYILHEANAFPGMSVKLLEKNASKIMIGFEEAKDRLKYKNNVIYTGTPTKFDVKKIDELNIQNCKKDLGLEKIDKKIILITCGSQGAKKINSIVLDMIKNYPSDKYYIILVTGDNNYSDTLNEKTKIEMELSKKLDSHIQIVKFVYDMDKMYKVSSMCVTRAGALTVTELAISGKPSILIPLPYATENHQLYNAKVLECSGGAKIIEESFLSSDILYKTIDTMIDNNILKTMSKNARSIANTSVDGVIYKCIKDTLKK